MIVVEHGEGHQPYPPKRQKGAGIAPSAFLFSRFPHLSLHLAARADKSPVLTVETIRIR